jgi:DNA-binding transcriptional regulator GbsR (MarR family)
MTDLTPAAKRFILHWGEMGSRWGVNRTVGQIHALLYLTSRPLNAEEIAETLSVARSNASTSLRELQAWGIVKVAHVLGDRRDYFESIQDVWELFRVIVAQRFQREIEPTLSVLETLVDEAGEKGSEDANIRERLVNLHEFFKTLDSWRRQMLDMSPREIRRAAKIGSKVRRLLRTGS